MRNFDFPTKLIGYFVGDISSLSDYKHFYENNLGVYKVVVTAPEMINPI
jgi:hypothetical protein